MGLGKTLQALCVSYYYRTEWPLLIVVPSSLRYPWIEELERWLPEIDPHSINLIQSGGDIRWVNKVFKLFRLTFQSTPFKNLQFMCTVFFT